MSENMAVAARWLEALRARDTAVLSRMTRYPFERLAIGDTHCSAKQPATTLQELQPIIDCLLANEVLTLREHRRAGVEGLALDRLQDWAEPWRGRIVPGAALLNAYVVRHDAKLDLDVWVSAGGVQAPWTNVKDGTAATSIAQRWLDALQRRDVNGIAKVTSYTFEVRDTGREARCGKRTARSGAELSTAVRCLLESKELHQAFETRAPIVEASLEDDSVPNSTERWWKDSVHAPLRQTYAGLSTPEGASFDIILMVAPDGVRAVWKYGTLEARD